MNRRKRRRKFALLKRDCYQSGHPKFADGLFCLCRYMASLEAEERKEIFEKAEAKALQS
jgi:hypothetical protein